MIYDAIIVGAGAAGLMTAITAAQTQGPKIALLDGQKKIGAKILMSGGTRCNVTNKALAENDYNSLEPKRVRNILRGFDNQRTIAFFQNLGVDLVLEETGKYFPSTHSGQTVLDALVQKVQALGVELKTEHKVHHVKYAEGIFTVLGEGFQYQARNVVLTTGGLSYPGTGSDGVGYRIAQAFGHQVIQTTPALTPLTTDDKDWKSLTGISLKVRLTLFNEGKKKIFFEDGFLFTHLGFSGPAALDISRHWLNTTGENQIFINFIPQYNSVTFEEYLKDVHQKSPRKSIKTLLTDHLPLRLAEVICRKTFIEEDLPLNQLTKEDRRNLTNHCVHYPLAVSGVVGYSKAEVTAGGVDLSEVASKSLESFLQPGLFFAGEILDADGRIGGFNFQWAWASGYTVGSALCLRMKGKVSS